jgi:RNA polymerase-binding transcription factor
MITSQAATIASEAAMIASQAATKGRTPVPSPLTARQFQEVELALERERHYLVERLRAYDEAERALSESQREVGSAGGDQADVAGDVAEEELVLTFQRTERARLAAVEKALHRMDEGTYGWCESCGRPIYYPRLRAVPWVATCRACIAQSSAGYGSHREPGDHGER